MPSKKRLIERGNEIKWSRERESERERVEKKVINYKFYFWLCGWSFWER